MFSLVNLALVGGLLACLALVIALVRWVPSQPVAATSDFSRSAARRGTMLRWTGVVAGLIVAYLAARSGELGGGLLLAAPLFGLCTLVGVLVGELAVRPPRGPSRSAAVEVRRVRDYLPRGLSGVVTAAGLILLVLISATTLAGSADDMGRAGRALFRQCSAEMSTRHGPWPGSFYTGRLAVVLLVGLLLAYLALRGVVARPRSGNADDLAADDAVRTRSARAVTGAVGILVGIPLAGVSITAAGGLLGIACPPLWWTIAGWFLVALVPLSLAMVSWCVVALLAPVNRVAKLASMR